MTKKRTPTKPAAKKRTPTAKARRAVTQAARRRSRSPVNPDLVHLLPDVSGRPLWRVKDAAEHCGVDVAQLYRYIAQGRLAALRIGAGSIRIPAAALAQFQTDCLIR